MEVETRARAFHYLLLEMVPTLLNGALERYPKPIPKSDTTLIIGKY